MASCSSVLNSESQMERVKEINEVMSIVGEICRENDLAKESRRLIAKLKPRVRRERRWQL